MEIAYRIYPAPNGTIYSDENVKSIDDVIELFDYCQIAEAMISKKGWDYLVKKFSLPELYKANKVSDWFDCEKIEEFIAAIEYEKSIAYNDAVEEALCFEWIDSTIKPLDKEHRIQRFTPRKPKSTYSQANKERLKWLLANKMIHPEFEDKIRTVLSDPFIFPNDIMDRLKEDEIAWRNYRHFSDAYKRIRIAYIEAARKRPEEFEKRLNNFICKVKENKMITGFGGIEKYY